MSAATPETPQPEGERRRPFRVSARTILHLGRDLISSDFVAVYELIKNGIDATRDRDPSDARAGMEPLENERNFVDLDVLVRIPHTEFRRLAGEIDDQRKGNVLEVGFEEMRERIYAATAEGAPRVTELRQDLVAAEDWTELGKALDGANVLTIQDWGRGMSLQNLEDIYLLIGTPNRDRSRKNDTEVDIDGPAEQTEEPIFLGEKGIGRLSAMRLGHRLDLLSTQREDDSWNRLTVDWRHFDADVSDLLENIEVDLRKMEAKAQPDERGTRVHITALRSEWSVKRLRELARDQFSRLTDPFTPEDRYPIRLRYNDEPVPIPQFNKLLFDNAHAVLKASFHTDDEPQLSGEVNYAYRYRESFFSLRGEELCSIAGKVSPVTLHDLGPFELTIYWYNRLALHAVDGIGDKRAVQKLVNHWSGGVMVFRDGFRVMPYGGPEDDWVELDPRALASGSYRVNRKQVIGRIHITRRGNPSLIDQTNREGLKDCEEKQVFINILRYILATELRNFIGLADEEAKELELKGIPAITKRWMTSRNQFRRALGLLIERFPAVKVDSEIYNGLHKAMTDIDRSLRDLNEEENAYQNRLDKMVNLAGLGLMVEILAHELNRATEVAVEQLDVLDHQELSVQTSDFLRSLKAQLNTLVKRLAILDPMSTARRQRKTEFDIVALARKGLAFYQAKFERHHIDAILQALPEDGPQALKMKAVEGQISMVIQNLLDNSIYWLKERRRINENFAPEILVIVDTREKEIRITDNGPGVSRDLRERVFDPFFSMKPPGERKGLGLYISREIAGYHGMVLDITDSPAGEDGNLHTFVLSFKERK